MLTAPHTSPDTDLTAITSFLPESASALDYWTLRVSETRTEWLGVRDDVVLPPTTRISRGAMVQVINTGGMGYGASSDLSAAGLQAAFDQALKWASATAVFNLIDTALIPRLTICDTVEHPPAIPWTSWSLRDKLDRLRAVCAAMKRDDRIVERFAGLGYFSTRSLLISSEGARLLQVRQGLAPNQHVIASQHNRTQIRSVKNLERQGGMEILDDLEFDDQPARLVEDALALLAAPDCPEGELDILLLPGQMTLQIHETIGHPLELDRILGDERNYAGTSFVQPDMFGQYQYGSDLLNVTFDPTIANEVASYTYDDDGTPAKRQFLIRNGILERPLGSALSDARASLAPGLASGLASVAAARASDWNRPPIDRMANLNIEPGTSSLASMIEQVDDGILMDTNQSWSIDDSRNKFQFGCEFGQRIRNGKPGELVRNPNYRGITSDFWHRLKAVGDQDSFRVHGVGNCGKGEPNQAIRTGHAAPACLFGPVSVFG